MWVVQIAIKSLLFSFKLIHTQTAFVKMSGVCRVCLTGAAQMRKVQNNKLLLLYEKLTTIKLNSVDGRPNTLCNICYLQLQKCHRFSDMAIRSESILSNLLLDGIKVTHQSFTVLQDINHLNLSISPVRCMNVITNEITGNPTDTATNETHKDGDYIKIEDIKMEREVKQETDAEESDSEDALNIEPVPVTKESTLRIKKEKQTIQTTLSCTRCNKEFKQAKSLESHMNIHTKEKIFQCNQCVKKFLQSSRLQLHSRHHDNETNRYCCDVCSKEFKRRNQLKSHLKSHEEDKLYCCDTCGKKFKHSGSLTLHKKIHKGDRVFTCETCGKAFTYKCNLQTHYLTHTKEKPFRCNQCEMAFGKNSSLKEHVRRLHTEVKAFGCNACGKSFDQECALSKHMQVHSAMRPFACQFCKKAYFTVDKLRQHMATHSPEAPYVCDRCDKAFKLPKYLQQHKLAGRARCKRVWPTGTSA